MFIQIPFFVSFSQDMLTFTQPTWKSEQNFRIKFKIVWTVVSNKVLPIHTPTLIAITLSKCKILSSDFFGLENTIENLYLWFQHHTRSCPTDKRNGMWKKSKSIFFSLVKGEEISLTFTKSTLMVLCQVEYWYDDITWFPNHHWH